MSFGANFRRVSPPLLLALILPFILESSHLALSQQAAQTPPDKPQKSLDLFRWV